MIESALAHAASGYRVVPLRADSKRPFKKGVFEGTLEPWLIDRWWGTKAGRGVGLALRGSGVLVLDIDGPEGEVSLRDLLDKAGCEALPDTYEVVTGRGRHLYFRQPEVDPLRVSQYGSQHGRKELDVKVTGFVVAPGVTHASGAIYRGTWDHIPAVSDLPLLPDAVMATLRRSSKPERRHLPSAPGAPLATVVPIDLGEGTPVQEIGEDVQRLLGDQSDGRDARIYEVVLRLVYAGHEPADVVATVLAHPLGAKAYERGRQTLSYMLHKVESAQNYLDAEEDEWSRQEFVTSAVTAGLSDRDARVLVTMGLRAKASGVLRMAQSKVGFASATANTAGAIKSLVSKGWLSVIVKHDSATPRASTYWLQDPNDCSDHGDTVNTVPDSHTPLLMMCGQDLSRIAAHDAFRPGRPGNGKPTLDGTFRIIALLAGQPMTTSDLAQRLRISVPTVNRFIGRLREAGIVVTDAKHHHLLDGLDDALDRAAIASGTTGVCVEQRRRAKAKGERYRMKRETATDVGSDLWLKYDVEELGLSIHSALVAMWAERGVSALDLGRDSAEGLLASIERAERVFQDLHDLDEATNSL